MANRFILWLLEKKKIVIYSYLKGSAFAEVEKDEVL